MYSKVERYLLDKWLQAARVHSEPELREASKDCFFGCIEALSKLPLDRRRAFLASVFEDLAGHTELSGRLSEALEAPRVAASPFSVVDAGASIPGMSEALMKIGATVAAFRLDSFGVVREAKFDLTRVDAYSKAFRDGLARMDSAEALDRFRLGLAGAVRLPSGAVAEVQK